MSQFIQEFEGIGTGAHQPSTSNKEPDVIIIVNNQISNTKGPAKIHLQLSHSLKIGELKDLIGTKLIQQNPSNQLSLMYRGKDLNEDLKTLKDLGMKSIQPDGTQIAVKIILSLKNILELEME